MKITEPRLITKGKFSYWKMPNGRIYPHVSGAQLDPADLAQQQQDPPAQPVQDTLTIPVEPVQEQQPAQQEQRLFTAADIEKARREEKDKVYGRLSQFESQIQTLQEEREERERRAQEAVAAAEEEARKKAEEEMSAKELLRQKEEEWNQRFQTIEQQREADRALFEKEREFQAVLEYRARALAENANDIMPELADIVSGNTVEEIDASIDFVKQKTAAILGQVVAQQQQQLRPVQRGVGITAPPVGPMEQEGSTQQVTPQDVKNMSMAEYAQHRDRLLGATRSKVRDQGLYG